MHRAYAKRRLAPLGALDMDATSSGGVMITKLLGVDGVLVRVASYGGGGGNIDSLEAVEMFLECVELCSDAAYALSNGFEGEDIRACSECSEFE